MSDAPQTDEAPSEPQGDTSKTSPPWYRMRPVFLRRFVRWALKPALILLIVAAVIHTALTLYFGSRVKSEITAIRKQGGRLEIWEVFPKFDVPAKENAAPLYLCAFALLDDPKAYSESPTEDMADVATMREAVAKDRGAIALTLEAAERPRCRFLVEWRMGPATLLPHLAEARGIARMLGWAAVVAAEDGKTEEAYRLIHAGLRMGQHVREEPCMISQMVSCAIGRLMAIAARRVLAKAPPKEMAGALAAVLDTEKIVEQFTASMQGERALILDLMHRHPPDVIAEATDVPLFVWSSYTMRPVQYASELEYLHYMTRCIDEAALPLRQSQFDHGAVAKALPWYACLARSLMPTWAHTAKVARDRSIASRGLLRTAIGLEVYRAKKGSYPDALDQVIKELVWPRTEDVFSGSDFVYKQAEDGFQLYSVGMDMDDDQGRPMLSQFPSKDRGRASTEVTEDGDLVWIPYGRKSEFMQRAKRQ